MNSSEVVAFKMCVRASTPPSSGRVIYDKNENIAETSEENVQSEHTINTMHTQGVTLEFPATNSTYPTFRGLFSARDPRFVHPSIITKGVIMNVNGKICQEGI